MWFDSLGSSKTDEAKGAAGLFGIKGILPHIFVKLSTRPGMVLKELKRSIIALSTHLGPGKRRSEGSIILRSQTSANGREGTMLGVDQCAHCLERKHQWLECRRYLGGKHPFGGQLVWLPRESSRYHTHEREQRWTDGPKKFLFFQSHY